MMPGSALNNFIVLLVKIFQAKKNFENRTISSWDNPYAKNRSKRLAQDRVKMKYITLVYLIIVQDGINVQDGKILKINKRAGWNKAVQVGILGILLP